MLHRLGTFCLEIIRSSSNVSYRPWLRFVNVAPNVNFYFFFFFFFLSKILYLVKKNWLSCGNRNHWDNPVGNIEF